MLARTGPSPRRDAWLQAALATALGLGVMAVALQALGVAGWLRRGPVLVLLALGGVLAVPGLLRLRGARSDASSPWIAGEKAALAALLLLAVPTLFKPLAPPAAFDELMYHLPYARQVAESGRIGIYEWLRYPWFPFNFNLLYAAALTVDGDVFPHLINALAGWLSVLMVYRLGAQYADRFVAALGAGIWLLLGDYEGALIDTGVALWVLCAFVALWWWEEDRAPGEARGGRVRWLLLAAFFLGLAGGSKYQALVFLPLAGGFVLRRERRVGVWLASLALFLLPCIYWYARNALLTGDPFNPIGARLFGFTNWNAQDYAQQLADLRTHANPPNGALWGVLLVPLAIGWKAGPQRAAFVFCAYSVAFWLLTSRYPRYMMASYPLLALSSALGWRWLAGRVASALPLLAHAKLLRALAIAGLVLAVVFAGYQSRRYIRTISPAPAERDAFLSKHVPGYEVLQQLRAQAVPGKLYQVGLVDAIYYAPNPVWGDIFGPWRYADFLYLPPAEMARKLSEQGFGSIVIHTGIAPYVDTQPGFERHFVPLAAKDGVKAYRILAPVAP